MTLLVYLMTMPSYADWESTTTNQYAHYMHFDETYPQDFQNSKLGIYGNSVCAGYSLPIHTYTNLVDLTLVNPNEDGRGRIYPRHV